MIIQELRDYIAETNDEAVVFDGPSFDRSIIGISDDDRVIYSYDKMVEEYLEDNNMDINNEDDITEAMEFIDYNTIRALPYAGEYAPIIMYPIDSNFFTPVDSELADTLNKIEEK